MRGRTVSMHGLASYKPRPQSAFRLFCFPYAGGSAHIYRRWAEHLPAQVDVCPVNLPGRAQRLKEQPGTRMLPLAETIMREILPLLDKPFAFFGYSMGALLAFEIARLLRRNSLPEPAHLFVAARSGPQIANADRLTYNMPEKELLEELRRLSGTSEEVLDEPELMKVVLPLIRADFELIQNYTYTPEPPLGCSISVYGGLQDREVSRERLQAWCQQTEASCILRMFPGGHFFINTAREVLLQTLTRELYQHQLLSPDLSTVGTPARREP
ncbi:MAG: putative thioesterase [Acidobacteria bacterium]|nr:putative thioesterase [Acidobacteriota bacterium]